MYFRRLGDSTDVQLFDGDRIAVLAALLVADLLKDLPERDADDAPPTVGLRAPNLPPVHPASMAWAQAGDKSCLQSLQSLHHRISGERSHSC